MTGNNAEIIGDLQTLRDDAGRRGDTAREEIRRLERAVADAARASMLLDGIIADLRRAGTLPLGGRSQH